MPSRLVADKNIENNKDGRRLEKVMLSSREWEILPKIIEILTPFEELTNKFSGKNYVTLSLLYPYIRILIKHLEKEVSIDENLIEEEDFEYIDIFNLEEDIISDDINLEENKDFEVVIHQLNQNRGQKVKIQINNPPKVINIIETTFKKSLLKWVSFYWSVSNNIRLFSSLLDPRFKDLSFIEIYEKREILESFNNQYDWLNNINTRPLQEISLIPKKRSLFDDYFNIEEDSLNNSNELTHYESLPKLSIDKNPLQWWKDKHEIYPNLSNVAREYLAVNATSVPSE